LGENQAVNRRHQLWVFVASAALSSAAAAQIAPGSTEQYGDRTRGQFGDPADGYFGDPSQGFFGGRFPAEPWKPRPPSDTSAVDSAPYVVLPGPSDPRTDRIDRPPERDPRADGGP